MPADLSALLEQVEQARRGAHTPRPATQIRPWYRIETKATAPKRAELWIFDVIGSTWLDDGTDAKSFTKDLAALDVDDILLHINSPGGDAFDGLAIYNALVDHKARVTAVVEGLAASAASYVFQAGDVRRINRAGQMMIHDAAGFAMGSPREMRKALDMLEKVSASVAEIYASRGGGTAEDWRAAMEAETWYTAAEAVEAGLADEAVDETPPDPPVRNTFDLQVFNYAGRQAAPPPAMPSATARSEPPAPEAVDSTPPDREGAAGMPDAAKLREALSLKADASDQEVTAALAAAGLTAKADPPPEPTTPPTSPPDPDKDGKNDLPDPQVANSGRVKVVDAAVWEAVQEQARRVDQLVHERQREKRDQVIADAMRAGKFGPSEKEHWQALWDKAPEQTEKTIAMLTPGRIPVNGSGYVAGFDPDEAAEDAMFDELFPPEMRYGKAGSRG